MSQTSEGPTLALLPGALYPPPFPLSRYRPPQVVGSLHALLPSATQPGDLVLVLGCQEPAYIREAVQAGRRVLGINLNPVALLAAELALSPPAPDEARAALTRLGDLPKSGRPFFFHARERYQTSCPTCDAPGVAEWFAWDRDTRQPFAKQVRCARCGALQEGPVNAADREAAAALPVAAGPTYHLALGRATSADDPHRERASALVLLYTPRNLALLFDIIHRLPQATSDPALRTLLRALVLEALDHGNQLAPYGGAPGLPRTLRPPPRYLERNVWLLMERALARYTEQHVPATLPAAPSLAALLESREPRYLLQVSALQRVLPALPPGALAAVVVHPVEPSAVWWALSALWATWLWDETPPQLRSFVGRRRLDLPWYQRQLARALQAVRSQLAPGGVCALWSTPATGTAGLASAVAAADAAGFKPAHWLLPTGAGARLALTATALPSPAQELAAILRARGEPTPTDVLRGAMLIPAGETAPQRDSALAATLAEPQFVALEGGRWWLAAETGQIASPLADQVEAAVVALLRARSSWPLLALLEAVYTRFSGPLTPDSALVESCLASYAELVSATEVALRRQDRAEVRTVECERLSAQLHRLGQRLGFTVADAPGWDCLWRQEDATLYAFRLTATAALGPPLLTPLSLPAERHCLVLPGGRAGLVDLKLQRDPRLATALRRDGWRFIKFRHLRRMLREITSPTEIGVFLGLDPIVEQDSAQIPLPMAL